MSAGAAVHRALERAAFSGEQPPVHLGETADRVGAFTCAEVYTVPGSQIRTACQMNAELAATGDAPAK